MIVFLEMENTFHNIIKSLANILSPLLGTISNSYIKNSSDLLNKINKISMENKCLASLNISHYIPVFLLTNVNTHTQNK